MFNRRWHAIVPAKRLKDAKSRLGRDDLALPFLTDVITALSKSDLVESVTIVSADPTICHLAEEMGCRVVVEHSSDGLLPAITLGIEELDAANQLNILVVLGDLPCLSTDHVNRFLTQGSDNATSFISDAEGTGSTMWMRTHSTDHMPFFGPRSRARHRESGAIEISDENFLGARRDVDTEVNLWDAVRIGVGEATHKALDTRTAPSSLSSESDVVVTITQSSPPVGVDENGHLHSLAHRDLLPLIAPRQGQRVVISQVTA